MSDAALLQVRDLRKHFDVTAGVLRRKVGSTRAVDGVSFAIWPNETLGLVGESGCGKTTTGRLLIRALRPTAGSIVYRGRGSTAPIDVGQLTGDRLHAYWRQVQMVFQDPYSSLDARMTVEQIVGEPLRWLSRLNSTERHVRVRELLDVVGLDPDAAERYPHAFSGGQRQRIGIARALAVEPELIIADEAVSALDVSVQAQVINLLQELQARMALSILFIAHDLSVVRHISDRVAVMYLGRIVEIGPTRPLYTRPRHPYTEALLSAVPEVDPAKRQQRILLAGDVGDPSNPPSGCAFHPRCAYATDQCRQVVPELAAVEGGDPARHRVACHHAPELALRGVGRRVDSSES